MTRVLMVNHRVPWPLDDGNALRVLELVRHRKPEIQCHLACLPWPTAGVDELRSLGVFDSVTLLPHPDRRRHWRRFFRRGNRDYNRIAQPRQFAGIQQVLREIVDREQIEVVVAVMNHAEEFTRPLTGLYRIVDQYDSFTLAHERQLAVRIDADWRERRRWRRRINEARSIEEGLGSRCDLITAIAPPDVARLQELNPGAAVKRLPNGIGREVLERESAASPRRRSVTFWGNLAFPVNTQAIGHFLDTVWKPHLANEGVEFVVVGPNAPPDLQALAAETPGFELSGFVDDLYAYLDQFPIMVNPMVTGGGLKNKVLEAFAAGLAVVSTRLGVDAFPEVDDRHCVITDEPELQARAILELLSDEPARLSRIDAARQLVRQHYTWDAVSSYWSDLIMNGGGVQLR